MTMMMSPAIHGHSSPQTNAPVSRVMAAAALLMSAVAASASAQQQNFTIIGTGVGANLATTSGTDPNWQVVALPSGTSVSGTARTGFATPPYDALVPRTVPGVWLGGGTPQTGYTTSGTTYRWISPSTSATSVMVSGTGSWIVAQSFTVAQPGTFEFNFYGTADNELTFLIDGTLNTSNLLLPTIDGGTQIGNTLSGTGKFASIHTFTGTATLTSGTHTAYAVVRDWGAFTGVLISQSTFALVPEPSTYAMAITGLACCGYSIWRRRQARRGRDATAPRDRTRRTPR